MARRGFTLMETVLVVALMGLLAVFVSSRLGPEEEDSMTALNRYLTQVRSLAMEQGPLVVVPEDGELTVLDGGGRKRAASLPSPQGHWRLKPERMILYRDGTVTPGIAVVRGKRGEEAFLVSVTARAYEAP